MSGPKSVDTRPLSPHLQIWRYHATMFASITHRFTGVALYFGSFLIAAWLIALGSSRPAYDFIEGIMFSLFGQVILFLWSMAVLYHFANGIRHMLWDGPKMGFNPKTASAVSIFNYAFAVLGAIGIWTAAYLTRGGV